MRMVHYYLALALVLAPVLLGTLVTGMSTRGSELHVFLGLFSAVACVATNTLFILFMIVTGRVLKAAMQARALPKEFLEELNRFFEVKKAYPMALLGAVIATATAVLGYGPLIGVPSGVHFVFGLATVIVHAFIVPASYRVLRENQDLLDRVASELDRLDQEAPEETPEDGEPEWAFGRRTRWVIFAASAWLPYLYWALVVWRGAFSKVPTTFLALTVLASALALIGALRPEPRAERS